MDIYREIDLADCPKCRGAGLLEEELGSGYYVTCMECGAHTAEIEFRIDEDRLDAARKAAELWNRGKVISIDPGE